MIMNQYKYCFIKRSRENVLMKKCLKGNEVPDTWTYTENQQLKHDSGKCMDYDISSFSAYLVPCNDNREEQRFIFHPTIASFDDIL
jgi:Ricin-type beta-trefoil lectin domain